MTIGARIPLPPDCAERHTAELVVPASDVRHRIEMSGRITDDTTTSYYNKTTLVCRINDLHVTTYDVTTDRMTADRSDRDVRVLGGG